VIVQIVNRISECFDASHRSRKKQIEGEIVHRFGLNLAHDAAGVARFARLDANVGSKMAYTFVVLEDGTIEQALPLDAIGWHARGWSETHLGIAVLGDFRKHLPTVNQLQALIELLAELSAMRGSITFGAHDQFPNSSNDPNKQCPGEFLDCGALRDQVRQRLRDRAKDVLIDSGLFLDLAGTSLLR